MLIGLAIDYLPMWSLLWVFVGLLLLMIEIGYRLGRFRRLRTSQEMESPVGTIVGATLGMLGFILAFSFGLAASRFDARRQVVVEEANAIGTTFLRAGLLPDDQAKEDVRKLLHEYVDLRIETVKSGNIELSLKPVEQIQGQLWGIGEKLGRNHPNSITVGLFLESLNEMIDIHSKRILVALRSRLPPSLWSALFLVTCFTMLGVGYHEGLVKSKRSPSIWIMVLSFCIVLKLIADLDRPQEGDLRVSQEAMESLQSAIHQEL